MKSSSIEVAVVLRRLAEMLEMGHSATVRLADQTILVPAKADVSCKYESATDTEENKHSCDMGSRFVIGTADSPSQ